VREQGYKVYLYFLWLPSPDMNVGRVADRVRQGGHNVPEDDVRRRYRRGIANFLHVYRSLTDFWTVYDNSGLHPRDIAFARADVPTILDAEAFQRFLQAGEEP